ncbi:hypothetical protein B0H13DRAFT_2507841 [Mycena leptocephala]|nr:hypothetical protein B0H13DRAFT_2507841 [Mycena leptocephala]
MWACQKEIRERFGRYQGVIRSSLRLDYPAKEAPVQAAEVSALEEESSKELPPTPEPEPEPAVFVSTTVHLARADDTQEATRRRRLFYLVRDRLLVALIDLDDANPLAPDSAEPQLQAEEASILAASLVAAMEDDPEKSVDTLPSATKILQPKDRYALSSARLAITSPDFTSRSGHLYDARLLLQASDPAISEVFSRGRNPQHWHVARCGVQDAGAGDDGGATEEMYMEVFRKETSLTDAYNALAGVILRHQPLPTNFYLTAITPTSSFYALSSQVDYHMHLKTPVAGHGCFSWSAPDFHRLYSDTIFFTFDVDVQVSESWRFCFQILQQATSSRWSLQTVTAEALFTSRRRAPGET